MADAGVMTKVQNKEKTKTAIVEQTKTKNAILILHLVLAKA